MGILTDILRSLQELADAKVTHNIDGFVHKAFSVAFGTSFDEVCCSDRKTLGKEICMAGKMMTSPSQCTRTANALQPHPFTVRLSLLDLGSPLMSMKSGPG